MDSNSLHTFHIPVMGLAFTVDSPIRVAHYGISSVISIMDDDLLEKIRLFYSRKFGYPHQEIPTTEPDYRAMRITQFLDLVDQIVKKKCDDFKTELLSSRAAIDNFLTTLPSKSDFRTRLELLLAGGKGLQSTLSDFLARHLVPGSIDVNIMTKVDRENHGKDGALPILFNDAHAALRGFANSGLSSTLVLSAGMHPRLYSYMESFPDFFPDLMFNLKKKIAIKVSDYRSAQVQGCFLAKKGLWVSEFRIESGLNCGGHAFATDGHLLGPILEEFKSKRESLAQMMHDLLVKSLAEKQMPVPPHPMRMKITVQGGVGTAEEHQFLLSRYKVDSVGWGSPFLLVPEAASVDPATVQLLAQAREQDLYTSNISPLGVPFNTVRGTTHEALRRSRIEREKPGSSCPKKFLALSKEYGDEGICTASRKYQKRKLIEIADNPALDPSAKNQMRETVLEKSCLCVGLSNSALLENGIRVKGDQSVVVCPGPNIAYFDRQYSLREMIGHIYGTQSVLTVDRPNMFVKELGLYVKYLKAQIAAGAPDSAIEKMRNNLLAGASYYRELFSGEDVFRGRKDSSLDGLESLIKQIQEVGQEEAAI